MDAMKSHASRCAALAAGLLLLAACSGTQSPSIPPTVIVLPEMSPARSPEGRVPFGPGRDKFIKRQMDVINGLIEKNRAAGLQDVSAAYDLRSGMISITASGASRAEAVAFCNAVAGQYVQSSNVTARILQLAQ
jgi:hypothetical protein